MVRRGRKRFRIWKLLLKNGYRLYRKGVRGFQNPEGNRLMIKTQGLALEFMKKLVCVWDPDYTKLIPAKKVSLDEALFAGFRRWNCDT